MYSIQRTTIPTRSGITMLGVLLSVIFLVGASNPGYVFAVMEDNKSGMMMENKTGMMEK